MRAEDLQPEMKHARAQDAQRGVVRRLRTLMVQYAHRNQSADDLEVLALQLRLASVNLMTSARELREVEDERKIILREMGRQRLRFESDSEPVREDSL